MLHGHLAAPPLDVLEGGGLLLPGLGDQVVQVLAPAGLPSQSHQVVSAGVTNVVRAVPQAGSDLVHLLTEDCPLLFSHSLAQRLQDVPGLGQQGLSLGPLGSLEAESPGKPAAVGLRFKLGPGVDLLAAGAHQLQLFAVLLGLPQPVDHVELLPRVGVALKL